MRWGRVYFSEEEGTQATQRFSSPPPYVCQLWDQGKMQPHEPQQAALGDPESSAADTSGSSIVLSVCPFYGLVCPAQVTD